jgi:hypothetical protein
MSIAYFIISNRSKEVLFHEKKVVKKSIGLENIYPITLQELVTSSDDNILFQKDFHTQNVNSLTKKKKWFTSTFKKYIKRPFSNKKSKSKRSVDSGEHQHSVAIDIHQTESLQFSYSGDNYDNRLIGNKMTPKNKPNQFSRKMPIKKMFKRPLEPYIKRLSPSKDNNYITSFQSPSQDVVIDILRSESLQSKVKSRGDKVKVNRPIITNSSENKYNKSIFRYSPMTKLLQYMKKTTPLENKVQKTISRISIDDDQLQNFGIDILCTEGNKESGGTIVVLDNMELESD